MTILKGDLNLLAPYTPNAATNTLTTSTPHGLTTGSRIRLVGGTLPTPLLANVDYFAIVSSATVFTLATTLANATAGTPIDIADTGAGALTFSEQSISLSDSFAVLINKEVSHPSWTTRSIIDALGAATDVGGVAEKALKTLNINNASPTIPLSYQHYLFLESPATAVIGSIPAATTGFILSSEAIIQTIAVGEPPRAVFFKLRARNA